MKRKTKIGLFIFGLVDLLLLALCLLQIFHPIFDFGNFGLFNAKGTIAQQQNRLVIIAILLMLLIIVPVVLTGFYVIFKYREGNNQEYDPTWGDRHNKKQFLWWSLPILIIILLSIINFKTAHRLDPSKIITADVKPLTIEVVALPWKWLFIYPDQNIATVNFVEFPQNTPVDFKLTADAPMSLFWIPQLGGQMAAMQGMVNDLNLEANQTGQFPGQNSEINGSGYAGMKFVADSTSQADFNAWVTMVKNKSPMLNQAAYDELAKPSQNNTPAYYSLADDGLYGRIILKYVGPPNLAKMHDD